MPETNVREEWIEKGACPECKGDVWVNTCNDLMAKYCLSNNGVDCYWCA